MAGKAENIPYLALYRKRFSTPAIHRAELLVWSLRPPCPPSSMTRLQQSAGQGVYMGEGRHHHISAQPLPTYHFIIDFMEMNLTDFLHNVFILKSDKTKP